MRVYYENRIVSPSMDLEKVLHNHAYAGYLASIIGETELYNQLKDRYKQIAATWYSQAKEKYGIKPNFIQKFFGDEGCKNVSNPDKWDEEIKKYKEQLSLLGDYNVNYRELLKYTLEHLDEGWCGNKLF